MRIEDNHVHQASRGHVEGHGKKEGHDAVRGRHDGHHHGHDGDGVRGCKRHDRVEISEEAKSRFDAMRSKAHEARGRELEIPAGAGKAGFLGALISSVLAGQSVNVTDIAKAGEALAPQSTTAAPDAAGVATPSGAVTPELTASAATSGMSASLEQLNFSATGTIKTGDGKEVGFTLSLNLTKASVAGFSASSSVAGQDPLSVNFAGTSSELFSMSFEFSINRGEEPEDGTGLFTVDKDDDAVEADEAHASGVPAAQQTDTAISAADFLKALRKAEFTSTYLSFTKTTIEASSSIAVAEGPPMEAYQIPGTITNSSVPLDLVA